VPALEPCGSPATDAGAAAGHGSRFALVVGNGGVLEVECERLDVGLRATAIVHVEFLRRGLVVAVPVPIAMDGRSTTHTEQVLAAAFRAIGLAPAVACSCFAAFIFPQGGARPPLAAIRAFGRSRGSWLQSAADQRPERPVPTAQGSGTSAILETEADAAAAAQASWRSPLADCVLPYDPAVGTALAAQRTLTLCERLRDDGPAAQQQAPDGRTRADNNRQRKRPRE
jgi:hypothetical protein